MKKGWFPKDESISEPFGKIDYLCGLLVLFISFGVYLHTLTPTVGFHDSGELITVAYTLGIAHPPGYPLYTLFGNLFITLIPIGNIAYRMNMESALFASLAVMMTYFIILKLSIINYQLSIIRIIPSVVAALILAFSATFWEQAVIAEKYTLNAFFFTLIIFILLKWQETQNSKLKTQNYLYLFAFLLGLSFCHHFQTIYLVPGSIFFILATSLRKSKVKSQKLKVENFFKKFTFYILHFTFFILLFLLPLTLWCYLPLRALQDPVLNWGDPDTLGKFFDHITAKHYQAYFVTSPKVLLQHLKIHIPFFSQQFPLYILWLSGIGLFFLAKKIKVLLFFLLIIGVNTLHSIRFNIPNIYDMYYIPSFILFSIFIGLGITGLSRKPALSFLFLILPFVLMAKNYEIRNKSSYYLAYDVGDNILRTTGDAPVIFESSDITGFPLFYHQQVLKKRPELIQVTLSFLGHPWYPILLQKTYPKEFSFSISEQTSVLSLDSYLHGFIEHNIAAHSIYIDSPDLIWSWPLVPAGLLFKAQFGNESIPDISYRIRIPKGHKDKNAEITLKNYVIAYNYLGKQKEAEAIQKSLLAKIQK